MGFNTKEIKEWIENGEGHFLDFKHKITNTNKIAKTIVAFANSRGGKIIVGVDDNKDLIGVEEEQEKFQLLQASQKFCFPKIQLYFETVILNKLPLLIVSILESKTKPHYWINKKGVKIIYIRSNDKCIVPNDSVIKNLENGMLSNAIIHNYAYHKVINEVKHQFLERGKLSLNEYAKLNSLDELQAQKRLLNLVLEGVLIQNENEDFIVS